MPRNGIMEESKTKPLVKSDNIVVGEKMCCKSPVMTPEETTQRRIHNVQSKTKT